LEEDVDFGRAGEGRKKTRLAGKEKKRRRAREKRAQGEGFEWRIRGDFIKREEK
jgi:hypothetical protein